MEQSELRDLLKRLTRTWENEVIEFKRTISGTDQIGRYFSALSNEANLRGIERAWLVLGVDDKTRAVIGTSYQTNSEQLQQLKEQIKQDTGPSISFRNIHVLNDEKDRVVFFEIPAAPRGIPIDWKGHHYGRNGESLRPLGLDKIDAIRQQTIAQDWTAQTVPGATLDDLDEDAVHKARESFAQKHANRFTFDEIAGWPTPTFLDRAHVTQNAQITRTALLLLGKEESAWRVSPHPALLTWKLEGPERAYEHFAPPFLLSTSRLYQRVRNIQLRLPPLEDELVPIEISKYDQRIVLEALHNCIAHQDYTRNGRIVVTERQDRLVFENRGDFFEGQPEDYLEGAKVPLNYRNPFLVQAMVELNMIDMIGYGIHDMHLRQAKRYLPMPDYDLSGTETVMLTIYGSVVDPAYTRLLIRQTDLSLTDILTLDRVQKQLPIPQVAATRLRRAGLVEGRRPNLHVSAGVAQATAKKADYIRTRAQDDEFYAKLLTDYLEKFGEASRADINNLLLNKVSDALNERQKYNKISNLMTKMRRRGMLVNAGSDRFPRWRLAEKFKSKKP